MHKLEKNNILTQKKGRDKMMMEKTLSIPVEEQCPSRCTSLRAPRYSRPCFGNIPVLKMVISTRIYFQGERESVDKKK